MNMAIATEVAYKNGYDAGYRVGKIEAYEEFAMKLKESLKGFDSALLNRKIDDVLDMLAEGER